MKNSFLNLNMQMTSLGLQPQNNTENDKAKIPIKLAQYNLEIKFKKSEEY